MCTLYYYNSVVFMEDIMKEKAFTLAEVLITLGIIGVVAAMTIPNTIAQYKNKVYATQLKKFCSEFSQAITSYQNQTGASDLTAAGLVSQNALDDFVINQFRIVKTCTNGILPCFANNYKTIKGGSVGIYQGKSYVLYNGSSIRPLYTPAGNKLINIMVDTNGKKGPNQLGKDLFFIGLYKNSKMDDYYDTTATAPLTVEQRESRFPECTSNTHSGGWGCFGKVLNDNWEITY